MPYGDHRPEPAVVKTSPSAAGRRQPGFQPRSGPGFRGLLVFRRPTTDSRYETTATRWVVCGGKPALSMEQKGTTP